LEVQENGESELLIIKSQYLLVQRLLPHQWCSKMYRY